MTATTQTVAFTMAGRLEQTVEEIQATVLVLLADPPEGMEWRIEIVTIGGDVDPQRPAPDRLDAYHEITAVLTREHPARYTGQVSA